jgi:hypothetical protein
MVNSAVEQAIARGEFDDLPGLGKPLPGLDGRRDPDWWIKGKLADEDIRGVGPAALTLRQEAADLRGRLDAVDDEDEVRKLLEDFNRKVRDAGLDPHTGHLVATPMRRVEEEIAAWRSRRA